MSDTGKRKFGTFWFGSTLSAYERACAHSFIARGYELTIFSYEELEGLPEGVKREDASTLVDKSLLKNFLVSGAPHIGHFSDLFRYEMILHRGLTWADLDIVMIDDLRKSPDEDILVKEEQGGYNNALLYLSDKKSVQTMIASALGMQNRNLKWGETGPLLLNTLVKNSKITAKSSSHTEFYPIEHYDIHKALLPKFRDECAAMCAGASTVHLYNNIIVKMGIWKEIAPPAGSYLHEVFANVGALHFFSDVYPTRVVENMITNYLYRLNGKELGIKSIVREAIPSLVRTYRHYRPA